MSRVEIKSETKPAASGGGGLALGAIAGIAIGAVLVVVVAVAVVAYFKYVKHIDGSSSGMAETDGGIEI